MLEGEYERDQRKGDRSKDDRLRIHRNTGLVYEAEYER
jgi:hypothetical protein